MPADRPPLTAESVAACAIDIIAAEGASALGVNRVARELGVKPPSLYNHVAGNAGLREAVVTLGWRRMADDLAEAREHDHPFAAMARAVRSFAQANPGLYELMNATSLDPTVDGPMADVNDHVLALFEPVLARAGLTGDGAIHAIRMMRACVHGFVALETTGQFRLGVDRDASFEWMLGALERGLVDS